MKAIYPGTFDPITWGHMDVIKRGAAIFDELIVGVLVNSSKTPLFTTEERVEMIKEEVKSLANVKVIAYGGLLSTLAKENNAVILRGIRSASDFDYELPMSQANKEIAGVDTVYLVTNPSLSFVSSSLVREIASFHGDISKMVSETVAEKVEEKFNK